MSISTLLMDGMPHGYCLLWNPKLLWLHAGADTVIAASYLLIPVSLVRFIRRRRDVPFNLVFVCFGAFILLCGATHLLGVYNIWVPNWWLSGYVKALTALASAATAVLVIRLLPQAIALPSPAQIRIANEQLAEVNTLLRAEAHQREAAQSALGRAHDDAEELVRVRTAELAQANRLLERSEARYRALVNASAYLVWTAEPSGRILDIVESSSSSGTRSVVDVTERARLVHPDDREAALAKWQHAIATGEKYESQHRMLVQDDVWRHVRVQAVPVRESDGTVREWVGSHVDISEQVEATRQIATMQEQLQQSQRLEAVGRLAGGIAHDFNNLLTVITGAGTLVLEDMPRENPSRRDVEDVVAAGTRAAALTAQLLAYSRKQVLQPQLIDINVILTDVQTMLRRLIGEHISITVATHADGWMTLADPNQLEQVILNLALNARDAMPDGGTITFETEQVLVGADYSSSHLGVTSGEFVMLAVSDTGVGMDAVTRAQIFEPFFTTKALGVGTGLGLATVYGIIRQSGGHIYVYSEPGLGTTFKIYLPRAEAGAGHCVASALPRAASVRGGESVLIVEDAPDVREFVARVLKRSGYVVETAESPAVALRLLESNSAHYDLLLSDVIMPGINGRELADLVVTQRPDIAVLFMSGYTDNAIVHHGVLDPRTNFLHKPFTPDQLLHEVRQALEATFARRQPR